MINNIVCNSTCLIGLERIGFLELLEKSFNGIIIPASVQDEIGFELH